MKTLLLILVLVLGISPLSVLSGQQNYSREFNHGTVSGGGDYLHTASNVPLNEVYITTFELKTIKDLIGSETSGYIKVKIVKPLFAKRRYRMTLCDINDNEIRYENGDYPCPDICMPPVSLLAPENTFDVADIILVASQEDVQFLNVHSSSRTHNGALIGTHTIYGLKDSVTPMISASDRMFTSLEYKE